MKSHYMTLLKRDQEIDVDEHPFNHMSLSKVIPSR